MTAVTQQWKASWTENGLTSSKGRKNMLGWIRTTVAYLGVFFKDQLAIVLFYPCLITARHELICGSEVLWQTNFLSGRIVCFFFSYCKVKDSSPQTKEIMTIHQEHTLGWIHFVLTYYIHITFSNWGTKNIFVSLTP